MLRKTELLLILFLFLVLFIDSGCILDNDEKDCDAATSSAFTNLGSETVLLYIDGKLETQIFAETSYWISLPSGHHKYTVYDNSSIRQEVMSGEFMPGDKINIIWK